MQVHYFERVPDAAVRRQFDGHDYATVSYCITADGVRECAPRMVRADGCRIAHGVAEVMIGRMGAAIAQRVNLPFGVVARDESGAAL